MKHQAAEALSMFPAENPDDIPLDDDIPTMLNADDAELDIASRLLLLHLWRSKIAWAGITSASRPREDTLICSASNVGGIRKVPIVGCTVQRTSCSVGIPGLYFSYEWSRIVVGQ